MSALITKCGICHSKNSFGHLPMNSKTNEAIRTINIRGYPTFSTQNLYMIKNEMYSTLSITLFACLEIINNHQLSICISQINHSPFLKIQINLYTVHDIRLNVFHYLPFYQPLLPVRGIRCYI